MFPGRTSGLRAASSVPFPATAQGRTSILLSKENNRYFVFYSCKLVPAVGTDARKLANFFKISSVSNRKKYYGLLSLLNFI